MWSFCRLPVSREIRPSLNPCDLTFLLVQPPISHAHRHFIKTCSHLPCIILSFIIQSFTQDTSQDPSLGAHNLRHDNYITKLYRERENQYKSRNQALLYLFPTECLPLSLIHSTHDSSLLLATIINN